MNMYTMFISKHLKHLNYNGHFLSDSTKSTFCTYLNLVNILPQSSSFSPLFSSKSINFKSAIIFFIFIILTQFGITLTLFIEDEFETKGKALL